MKVAVFASGDGSNFEVLAQHFQAGEIAGELVLLFSDKPEAYVCQRAERLKIPFICLAPQDFATKQEYETALLEILRQYQVELIVLAGYMRIIGKTLLTHFPNRIVNIHPSLLPDFPGKQGIKDAFEAGVTHTGVTVHYVDAGVDTGPIIAQEKVAILPQDTLETVTEKIHQTEHALYPRVIAELIKKEIFPVKKRALISVSDKTGIVMFAKELVRNGFDIISTGGTQAALQKAEVPTIGIEAVTNFPEMMDGRVKTLHPKIHGGLLGRRDRQSHLDAMIEHDIDPIDLVVVNLYPFKETIMKPDVTEADAIENIDIGGPSMLRSAAKNFAAVTVVIDPQDYPVVLEEIKASGDTQLATRKKLAAKVFRHTAAYDALIGQYLTVAVGEKEPEKLTLTYERKQSLRYGENHHQRAAFYQDALPVPFSIASAKQLHGKELSFNNIKDADAAIKIAAEFTEPAVVAVKHMNPCGVGTGSTIFEAYQFAYEADPVSIFGGIVVLNRPVDLQTAEKMHQLFLEIIIAPSFDADAFELLSGKKNLRLLTLDVTPDQKDRLETVSVLGGLLVQEQDVVIEDPASWQIVTKRQPTTEESEALAFNWKVVKHVKSNAIVVGNAAQTLGVGAGQMNRVGAVKIAVEQAEASGKMSGAVLASDAFFPMNDSVEYAAKHGIKAIVQPGGSIKDQESIEMADRYDIAMVFTDVRHFKH